MEPRVVKELKATLGPDRVFDTPADRVAYSYDATWGEALPAVVVLPLTTAEVSATLRIANRERIPVVPRGAASGLSGGAVPVEGGICLGMTRMNRILEINLSELVAVVQPGVVNMDLQDAAAQHGLFFPPDPGANATVGGMLANNAAGIRTVKYGASKDNVLRMQVALADGRVVFERLFPPADPAQPLEPSAPTRWHLIVGILSAVYAAACRTEPELASGVVVASTVAALALLPLWMSAR